MMQHLCDRKLELKYNIKTKDVVEKSDKVKGATGTRTVVFTFHCGGGSRRGNCK